MQPISEKPKELKTKICQTDLTCFLPVSHESKKLKNKKCQTDLTCFLSVSHEFSKKNNSTNEIFQISSVDFKTYGNKSTALMSSSSKTNDSDIFVNAKTRKRTLNRSRQNTHHSFHTSPLCLSSDSEMIFPVSSNQISNLQTCRNASNTKEVKSSSSDLSFTENRNSFNNSNPLNEAKKRRRFSQTPKTKLERPQKQIRENYMPTFHPTPIYSSSDFEMLLPLSYFKENKKVYNHSPPSNTLCRRQDNAKVSPVEVDLTLF